MSNTIGPALQIGGNTVELKTDGKIRVTNPKGKIKTLTQDEFRKQTIKNADKIASGEDFEYKKDHKGLKIAGAAVGTAAITLGVIYRKEIGKYLKNFSFKKFWNDIKGLFKSNKKGKTPQTSDLVRHNVYKNDGVLLPEHYGVDARLQTEKLAKTTRKAKNEAIAGMTSDKMNRFDSHFEYLDRSHKRAQSEYEYLFDNLTEADFTTRHNGEMSEFFDHMNKPADYYLR